MTCEAERVCRGRRGICDGAAADAGARDAERHTFHRPPLKSQRGEINSCEMKTFTHQQLKAGMDKAPLPPKQDGRLRWRRVRCGEEPDGGKCQRLRKAPAEKQETPGSCGQTLILLDTLS